MSSGRKSTPRMRLVPIETVRPYQKNPRTHPKSQIRLIEASIVRFGVINPVVVDADSHVLCGHARLEALRRLGFKTIPVIRVEHLTDDEARAYRLADNKIAESGGWDRELLAFEVRHLLEVDFDLTLTGFATAEIDLVLGSEAGSLDQADGIPESGPPVSRNGDLWEVGDHRLLCGNCLKESAFSRLLSRTKAQMVFTDPPYNVPIDGHVCGLGAVKHREFAMAFGEMSESEFISFLLSAFRHLARFSANGSIHFVCMDWRHIRELLAAATEIYRELKNLCVWNKDNGGMGSFYRSQHELIFVFKNGSAPHINNIDLGRYGRNRTNVWDYPGVNSLGEGRLSELAMHPTVKPVALVADAILDCSKRDGIILDCFGGSGTTLIAAERTGRRGYLIEFDPVYVDVTIRRYQKLTGQKAVHAETGRTFDETADERSAIEATEVGDGL